MGLGVRPLVLIPIFSRGLTPLGNKSRWPEVPGSPNKFVPGGFMLERMAEIKPEGLTLLDYA